MRRSGYPQLDEHIDVHRRFVQETTEMVAAHLEGHGSTIDELARFMEAWLEDHIDAQDRPLIAHLRAWAGS